MRKAYFGISLSNRPRFDAEIDQLKRCLASFQYSLFVFVDVYSFTADQATEMMQTAFRDLDASDVLIVELSKKAIGVGVEVGYAVAKGIPIIYLKRQEASYSTTVGGSADYFLAYNGLTELEEKMTEVMKKMVKNDRSGGRTVH
ncbi:MAG: nucleoside 2-deoxyribosyltransferase [Bacteroidota bacterium]